METGPGADTEFTYLRKWQEIYPNITPPDLSKLIDKNGVINIADVERSLSICYENIEHLMRELERERALVDFFHEMLKKRSDQKCNKNRFNLRHINNENSAIPFRVPVHQTDDICPSMNIYETNRLHFDVEGNCRDISTNDNPPTIQIDKSSGDKVVTGEGVKNSFGDSRPCSRTDVLCDVSVQQLLENIDETDFFLPDDNFGHLSDDNTFELLTQDNKDFNSNNETPSSTINEKLYACDSSSCEQVESTSKWKCCTGNTVVIRDNSSNSSQSVSQKSKHKDKNMESDSSSEDSDTFVGPLLRHFTPKRPAPPPPLPSRSRIHSSQNDRNSSTVVSNRKCSDNDMKHVNTDNKCVSDISHSRTNTMEDCVHLKTQAGDCNSESCGSVLEEQTSKEPFADTSSDLKSNHHKDGTYTVKKTDTVKEGYSEDFPSASCATADDTHRSSHYEFSKVAESPLSALATCGNIALDILVHDDTKHSETPLVDKTNSSIASDGSQPKLSSNLSAQKCEKSPILKPKRKAPRAPAYENWSFHVAITDNEVNIIETGLSDSDSECDENNSVSNIDLSDDLNVDGPDFSDNSVGGDYQNVQNVKVKMRKKKKVPTATLR